MCEGREGRGRGVERGAGAAYTLNPGMMVPEWVGGLMSLQTVKLGGCSGMKGGSPSYVVHGKIWYLCFSVGLDRVFKTGVCCMDSGRRLGPYAVEERVAVTLFY